MLQPPQKDTSPLAGTTREPSIPKDCKARSQPVTGRRHPPRLLIIEDEFLIALLIEEMSRDLGYRISGIAHDASAANKALLAKRNFDAVLLDVNLDGRSGPELADRLVKRGIPFAFVTGYGYVIEPRHETIPILEKPFSGAELRTFLEKLVGPALEGPVAQPA